MTNQDRPEAQGLHGYRGVFPYLPPAIREALCALTPALLAELEEIRLRLASPVWLRLARESLPLLAAGDTPYLCGREDIQNALHLITASSVYALEEELRRGYVTLPGGHRVGLTGKAILAEGRMKSQRDIASINYRIAKTVAGRGRQLLPRLRDGNSIGNTLIFSPPGAGKTTLLRELAVLLSDGCDGHAPLNVAIVDERSELAGTFLGVPQLYVGRCTDVLDGAPKAEGMMLMIRSMAPEVIVTDEIGSYEDKQAIMEAVNSGIRLLLSAHGKDLAEIQKRPVLRELLADKVFRRLVCLDRSRGPGTVAALYDAAGAVIAR